MYLIRSACTTMLAVMCALPAGAEECEPDELDQHEVALVLVAAADAPAPAVTAATAEEALSPFGKPADNAVLERTRGGSDTLATDTRLSGTVGGNTAINVNTGANVIQASSFANASGIPIVIQNSGANVLIQNATVINLQFK